MKEEHKKLINTNFKHLVDSIDLKHGLWDVMRSKDLVDIRIQDDIQSHGSTYKQVEELLNHLLRVGDDSSFDKFCKCLIETRMDHIVRDFLTYDDKSAKKDSPTSHGLDKSALAYVENEDLNDNIHDVVVKPCDKHFYENNKSKSYPMEGVRRGDVLIINVKKVSGGKPRDGTDIDRDKLICLWEKLGFAVRFYNDEDDLKAEDILKKVKNFLAGVPKRAQACAIFILSHGSDGFICGTDGEKVKTSDIEDCLTGSEASHLTGKPKLLFYQACRGGDAAGGDVADEVRRVPVGSDIVIGYPTIQGYKAWRNSTNGSWYIAAVVQVFMEHACTTDVLHLLTMVNAMVSKKVSSTKDPAKSGMMQCAPTYYTLNKLLYFFPGI